MLSAISQSILRIVILGMQWEGQVYIDKTLPFGLCSSPKIFSAISDTLEWILLHHGMSRCLYYIDAFITMGTAGSEECSQNLKLMLQVCKQVGLPIAPNKVEGPTAVLEFLGIEFNTEHMTMHLPSHKLTHLKVIG